ncbi:LamG-like jellyroll fold domain-containing protein [Novipirellula artificiosorum]|uniref:FecR protein n=1 Tax=Novipirellula artificiosorum TaxID=2528016 RepID=A0A5C6D5K8_9BACT|nr:LamG-like jellyroll fold domain-containing protein [Novipirellula artificiosorum]TWU32242.1 FecR protein [Novipirellula artificiosorum]
MSDLTDLRPLFADYARGGISAEQLVTLEAALRADADLRRDFIEYINVDSALSDLAALSESEVAEIEVAKHRDESTIRVSRHSASFTWAAAKAWRAHRVAAIAGSVAATLLFATILWVANPFLDNDVQVAMILTRVDAALAYAGQRYDGAELAVGEYRLDRGLLHLRFHGGVTVYIEAPARFDAVSGNRLLLRSGRLSANVPPEGVGFTVDTPDAEVIDFGTEFSIDVESSASEVHVFKGLVRVQPKSLKDGQAGQAVSLQSSQAVKIDNASKETVGIQLATDRFIRSFDEPKRTYPRAVKQLSPIAYYRMPIRDKGLVADPPQYSGVVLTGDGVRPPHACGVDAGGSLRVRAESTGRGGRVDSPPPLGTGQFTLAVFVYLESKTPDGTVATNIRGAEGNFELALDDKCRLQGTIRDRSGQLRSVTSAAFLPLRAWRLIVMKADGDHLRVYVDGQLVASVPCATVATSATETVWFGTDAEGAGLWDGRIDELAMFDQALSDSEIAGLYQAALAQMAKPK